MRQTEDETELRVLINALKWQYSASDHEHLVRLKVFKLLREGSEKVEKDKNKIKYSWGHRFKYHTDEQNLTKEVLDLFEQVLNACIARILKPDSGA